MNKYVVMPDSFKGTMSSDEICTIMERAIKKADPGCQVTKIPVADGGEGSVDAFLQAVGGEKIFVKTRNPFMEDMESFYGILKSGEAVIEMAASAGLPLVEGRGNPKLTTTYGVGQLIEDALSKGVKKIVLGLGGSSTNDCGVGMLAALGVKFYGKDGEAFLPTGGTLSEIESFAIQGIDKRLKNVEFVTMCDIDNPLFGLSGAAHVFARQKGATDEDVLELDENLKAFSKVVMRVMGDHDPQFPGAGAAGGMGYAMKVILKSKIQMGIETVLYLVNFEEKTKDAKLIFTGEGKLDGQSLRGKVVIGIGKKAKMLNVPVIAVVGDVGDGFAAAYDLGVSGIFSINRVAKPFSQLKLRAKEDMESTMLDIMRLYLLP